ncbi:MAG: hypothetical protein ACMUIU_20065 [bacterium]
MPEKKDRTVEKMDKKRGKCRNRYNILDYKKIVEHRSFLGLGSVSKQIDGMNRQIGFFTD